MADNAYIPPIPKTKIKVAGDIGTILSNDASQHGRR